MTDESSPNKPVNLFDYTETDLFQSDPPVLTYYEILNCPVYATQNEVKKAYRKASLKYHPDKTGRGEDDYVFLAVKAAHDTLIDNSKRQAYDSTVLPFDDSIPATREKLLQDSLLKYTDNDFFKMYGPVFDRNLRFDARLRPDLVKGNNSKKINQKNHHHAHTPPTLGDEHTPLEKVHQFYEYWVRFDSWRDFSSQAADELQMENELENAESRFEKRWIQKEIDKRARVLKRQEMQRIQTLVERAMEADPRLRMERQRQQQQKERAAAERLATQQRQKEELERNLKLEAEQSEIEKARRQEEKIQREKEKKILRKERQQFRKQTAAAFESCNFNNGIWTGSYELNQDIDYLCSVLDFDSLQSLNLQFQGLASCPKDALQMVHERVLHEQRRAQKENEEQEEDKLKTKMEAASESVGANSNGSTKTSNKGVPWTKDEISALAKAVKKYPPGGGSRWDQISLFVNNLCKQQNPRSKEECIDKYNQIAREASAGPGSASIASSVSKSSTDLSTSELTVSNGSNDIENVLSGKEDLVPAGPSEFGQEEESAVTAGTDESDPWTSVQDQELQDALAKFPSTMDKNERWTNIAKSVSGKSKKQCVQRFKTIREALLAKNST